MKACPLPWCRRPASVQRVQRAAKAQFLLAAFVAITQAFRPRQRVCVSCACCKAPKSPWILVHLQYQSCTSGSSDSEVVWYLHQGDGLAQPASSPLQQQGADTTGLRLGQGRSYCNILEALSVRRKDCKPAVLPVTSASGVLSASKKPLGRLLDPASPFRARCY